MCGGQHSGTVLKMSDDTNTLDAGMEAGAEERQTKVHRQRTALFGLFGNNCPAKTTGAATGILCYYIHDRQCIMMLTQGIQY